MKKVQVGHSTIHYAGPGDCVPVKAEGVLLPDGTIRTVRLTGVPDTFFSIPSTLRWKGKTVSGFVSQNSNIERLVFSADRHSKHYGFFMMPLFPPGSRATVRWRGTGVPDKAAFVLNVYKNVDEEIGWCSLLRYDGCSCGDEGCDLCLDVVPLFRLVSERRSGKRMGEG